MSAEWRIIGKTEPKTFQVGFNSEFSFLLTKAIQPNLPCYFLIAGDEFIHLLALDWNSKSALRCLNTSRYSLLHRASSINMQTLKKKKATNFYAPGPFRKKYPPSLALSSVRIARYYYSERTV